MSKIIKKLKNEYLKTTFEVEIPGEYINYIDSLTIKEKRYNHNIYLKDLYNEFMFDWNNLIKSRNQKYNDIYQAIIDFKESGKIKNEFKIPNFDNFDSKYKDEIQVNINFILIEVLENHLDYLYENYSNTYKKLDDYDLDEIKEVLTFLNKLKNIESQFDTTTYSKSNKFFKTYSKRVEQHIEVWNNLYQKLAKDDTNEL
ncbi:hypothetical protein GE118_03595 [Mycoplasma sp. NEAQ87857]|uniref:hypothetical protein n=1 Tax=Mycoplasma sp. NEAQ87857 TaxID=2683967 RepID=UPI001317DD24|nr:hypothetical protein [Mycoplasma sp. NEAQ87857]QGZ97241.1 hypothetical protein GE118_00285 [Mycoplasma sp. NEAQ87857]QGZ97866.1 hypothetical protein GE118_03595 [Mycoplasma sp. NEAQ87857]